MFNLRVSPNKACQRALQLFMTLLAILLVGKLVTLVPVMHKLDVFTTFKAAELVWFGAKLSALCVFYFSARFAIEAIPNRGGAMAFLRGVAEPATALLLAILAQDLFWHVLSPFVQETGRSIYFGCAILLIVAISIWLVLQAYRYSNYLIDFFNSSFSVLARFVPATTVQCGMCSGDVSSKARFCNHCGHKMQKSLSCRGCGATIEEGQKFCQNCGAAVEKTG